MLSRLNRTTGDLCDKTIIELFEEQVEHKPQSVALCYKDKQLTYLELDKVTNQTARYLIERWEIKPGVFVATAIDNSEWMIVLLLSILKAGAAYVPVGINYPMDRINRILQDCGTKVLITDQQGLLNVLYNLNVNIVDRLSIEKEIDRYENGRIDIARDTSSIMYSIYTSGSTGNPKGVVVEYNGVVNLIQWMWKEFEFDHRDIIIQKTPYIFDVSVWELFIGLCFGAKTVMCEREAIYDPGLLQDCLNDNCITVAHFVPTMLNVFLDYHTLNDQSNYSLKRLFVGGEELKKATVNKYYDQFEAPLYNLYGPTETSIYSTSDYVSPAESIISIGKPIDNTEIIILDEKMNPVPIGVNGMIYITGIGLARGYLNEVEKTHNSFTYNGMEGERSYCTGDVGRWLPDGRIRFIGRRDNQVKIRGHRIELSEIENAIISQVGIENAVVVVGQTQEETSILLAYYSGDSEISGVKIREHLIAQLPDYMLPEHYIWLNEIPKTANNKVDRKRLPDFKDKISKIQKSSELPQTATEKKLVEIWENVLGIKNIEVDSNFFEIGGHSLKAMNVVMEIHKQFNVSPKLKELFKQPTIKELSNVVDNLCAMDSYRHKSIEMDDQYESIVI
ncbi:MAG: non-ribosomal peptide synthetase [Bacteroidota bacterium]